MVRPPRNNGCADRSRNVPGVMMHRRRLFTIDQANRKTSFILAHGSRAEDLFQVPFRDSPAASIHASIPEDDHDSFEDDMEVQAQ
jgi:hypothetical protein